MNKYAKKIIELSKERDKIDAEIRKLGNTLAAELSVEIKILSRTNASQAMKANDQPEDGSIGTSCPRCYKKNNVDEGIESVRCMGCRYVYPMEGNCKKTTTTVLRKKNKGLPHSQPKQKTQEVNVTCPQCKTENVEKRREANKKGKSK